VKKYFLFPCLFFLSTHLLLAQVKPKPKQKEPAPTQKEMEEAMQEAQKELDAMSPEDKRLMDSMGIKMPSMKNIPKVSDKQLAAAWDDENRLVPKKDAARLSAIPATPSEANLSPFIIKVNTAFVNCLPPVEKVNAESAYQSVKQNAGISGSNAAISFWLMGSPLTATYIMGKICQEDPGNIDNINNYAAMLSMAGAEQAAIPILQNLNRRFPGNSTLLNNIGQAWFGLGDMEKAGRYLDSAIRIYSYHAEANYSKCLIEESKGNTAAAVEAMLRSIRKSYSAEKENKLKKLGRKLSSKDVDFPFPMPQDPLGLEKFSWPGYPKTVTESKILEAAWTVFKEKCDAEINQLNAKSAQLEQASVEAIQKRTNAIIQASNSGGRGSVQFLPWFAPVATLKLNYLVDDKDGRLEQQLKTRARAWEDVLMHISQFSAEKDASEKVLSEKYDPLIGEGRPNPLAEYCNAVNGVRNQFLEKANREVEMFQKNMIEEERKMTNDQVYYAQYINWPEEFEVIKVHAKMKWLTLIKNQGVQFQDKGPYCVSGELDQDKIQKMGKLQAFDEVACKYHSKVDFDIMDFRNDCSFFEARLKLGPLNYTRKIDSDDHDRLIAASLQITASAGKGFEKGPVKAEAKAEVGGKLEWNDKEFTNWEVWSELGLSGGSNLGYGDKSIDIASVNARIGMNSGASVTGKILSQTFNLGK
jgi:tetratricopeptide (TPR) repeat protein